MNNSIYEIQSNIGSGTNGEITTTKDGSFYSNDKEERLIYGNSPVETVSFKSDVSEDQAEVVNYVINQGYMVGTGEHTFSPNDNLTRAQAVMSLYRAAGSPPVSSSSTFSDVNSGDWYSTAIAWAKENNIVAGFEDGTFRPNDYLTNQQMTAILAKYAEHDGKNISSSGNLDKYSDSLSVSNWAKNSMAWAVESGVYTGDHGNLNPNRKSTRYDFAKALMNYDEMNKSKGIFDFDIANIRDNIEDFIHNNNGQSNNQGSNQSNQNSYSNNNQTSTSNNNVEELTLSSNTNKEAVKYVLDRNLMSNLTNDDFGEESLITRAQLIQTLYSLSGRPYTGINNTFPDVNNNAWYNNAVTWAQNVGLISGYTDGTFRPNEKVNPTQFDNIMKRYAQLAGGNYVSSGFNIPNIRRIDLANALMNYDTLNNGGSGKTLTMPVAKTNNVQKENSEQILRNIQNRYNNIPNKKNGNYSGFCGQLTCDQLAAQGLINDSDRHSYGKDQAAYIANKGTTGTGHRAVGYAMSSSTSTDGYRQNCQVFEKMIADNNGNADNIVISFGAWDGHPYGHVCLVSKISNGYVYLIDNTRYTSDGNNRVATKLSISEFEDKYFHSFPACYMTQIY